MNKTRRMTCRKCHITKNANQFEKHPDSDKRDKVCISCKQAKADELDGNTLEIKFRHNVVTMIRYVNDIMGRERNGEPELYQEIRRLMVEINNSLDVL